ncbi:cytochrome P450 [Violaceomyces palustris]|uniref:Cytochrome P450 n=1 Tax=Violaceomyces palustris TaxID=1673888 RepID=A0ACD0NXA0_9BASI|nr:cytochrome P450 [Violaceomyces palustris]
MILHLEPSYKGLLFLSFPLYLLLFLSRHLFKFVARQRLASRTKGGGRESVKVESELDPLERIPTRSGEDTSENLYDARRNLRLGKVASAGLRGERNGVPVMIWRGGTGLLPWPLDRLFSSSDVFGTGRRCRVGRRPPLVILNSSAQAVEILERRSSHYSSRSRSIAAGEHLSDGRRLVLKAYGRDYRRLHKAFLRVLTKEKVRKVYRRVLEEESERLVRSLGQCRQSERCFGDGEASEAGSGHGRPDCGFGDLGAGRKNSGATATDLVYLFTASSALQIAYSRVVGSKDDEVIKELEEVSEHIAEAFRPGAYWVEDLPWLNLLPFWMCPWKKRLKRDHDRGLEINRRLVEDVISRLETESEQGGGGAGTRAKVEDEIERGRSKSQVSLGPESESRSQSSCLKVDECCTSQLLRDRERLGLDMLDIIYLSAQVFEAGTETTAMTLNTFLLACVCFPHFVKSAREELDSVMGKHPSRVLVGGRDDERGSSLPSEGWVPKGPTGGTSSQDGGDVEDSLRQRLPDLNQVETLPFLNSVVKEVLRLTPTCSSGISHTSTMEVEDEAFGIKIPPGSEILPNTFGIHHDEALFRDPYRFDPWRYLPPSAGCGKEEARWEKTSSTFPSPSEKGEKHGPSDHVRPPEIHPFGFGRRLCPGAELARNSILIAISRILYLYDLAPTPQAYHLAEKLLSERSELEHHRDLSLGKEAKDDDHHLHGSVPAEFLARERRLGILLDAHNTFIIGKREVDECLTLSSRRL